MARSSLWRTGLKQTMVINGASLGYDVVGEGRPLLLLHGFPQTRATWRKILPILSDRYKVFVPDLPGYGDSDRLGEGMEAFEKGRLASHLVAFMAELGYERFAAVGHDRGGLIVFRMGLDFPQVVTHVGVLDILPTVDNWAALQGQAGVFAFHLYLLAQPTDLPERLIGAAPDVFFGHFLDSWTRVHGAIDDEARSRYLEALRHPGAIHAICDDYRASAFLDGTKDAQDLEAGRRLEMPVLAVWQDPGDAQLPFDPHQIWSSWAPRLTTGILPCGHFLREEKPEDVAHEIDHLLQM